MRTQDWSSRGFHDLQRERKTGNRTFTPGVNLYSPLSYLIHSETNYSYLYSYILYIYIHNLILSYYVLILYNTDTQ